MNHTFVICSICVLLCGALTQGSSEQWDAHYDVLDVTNSYTTLQDLNCDTQSQDTFSGVATWRVWLADPALVINCFVYTSSFQRKECYAYPSTKCPLTLTTVASRNQWFGNYDQLCAPNMTDPALYTRADVSACFDYTALFRDGLLSLGVDTDANWSPFIRDRHRLGFVSPYCVSVTRRILSSLPQSSVVTTISYGAGYIKCPPPVIWFKNNAVIPEHERVLRSRYNLLRYERYYGHGIYYQDCQARLAVCFRIVDLPGVLVTYHACPPLCGILRPNTRSSGLFDWLIELIHDVVPSIDYLAEGLFHVGVGLLSLMAEWFWDSVMTYLLHPCSWLFRHVIGMHVVESVLIFLLLVRAMPWIFASLILFPCWVLMLYIRSLSGNIDAES